MLTFKQSLWLKAYIDFNTCQRSLAGDSFLNDFFILMNNSVFGRTQENLRNCVHVELVIDAPILRKRVAPLLIVATLTLNRPIYVGFSVLELSRMHMYDFHYNHMCVKYPRANHLRILFTDRDRLACAVQTDAIYRDMAEDAASRYDFSEYPLDHPLHDTSNRKALQR